MTRTLLLAILVTLWPASAARAQLEPPGTGGIEALDLDLRRLGHVKRVLVIGAHPDDEDTELLAWLARGQGAQAAYLSLTRGEGGQNLIGAELGIGLGLLRSEELLAARRIDGARQFFTRAYDFGYSKSEEEAFRFWPRDSVLKDVVRVIRRFRPQVVVSIFAPGGGGHGQHRVAGTVAHEAFDAAGDASRFPELASEEGLAPHAPSKLYRSSRFDRESATLTLETGVLDPIAGRSYHQIAMASRSRHRSQDQGRIQDPGPSRTYLGLVRDGTSSAALFAGVDTTLGGLAGGASPEVRQRLARFARLADSARAALGPRAPERIVPGLAGALAELRAARRLVPAGAPWRIALDEQERFAETALAAAAGLVLDAVADDESVAPGQRVEVRVSLWNAGPLEARVGAVRVDAPAGWSVEVGDVPRTLAPGTEAEMKAAVTVAADAPPTRPYFLDAGPPPDGWYDWRAAPPAVRGLPFEDPPLTARAVVRVAGAAVTLEREVTYRYADQATGEVRRPLHVVPRLGVRIEPDLVVWPVAPPAPRSFAVTVTNHGKTPAEGTLHLETPPGWPAVAAQRFRLEREDESRTFTFDVAMPRNVRPGALRIAARAAAAATGGDERASLVTVDYPHIRPRFTADSAVASVRAAEIALPALRRVGYVRGAADRVPEALRAVGLPVEVLDDATLRGGALDAYDAIVIGSRAYETDPALAAANERLLEYARRGGTLIVQYQQYAFVRSRYAPYPLEIARPHDRVTDETAAPQLLVPEHPVFRGPNEIGPADWEGWVQERGLYFPREWDERYAPLVAFRDPGEAPKRGALLVARVGEGVYAYTGLSFFRQLPAGVPGAYRLFANLLALE